METQVETHFLYFLTTTVFFLQIEFYRLETINCLAANNMTEFECLGQMVN